MAQIKDEKQYRAMMVRIDELFFETDERTPADDPRLQELDLLSALVEEYEKEHNPIEMPTLSATMNARLADNNWTQKAAQMDATSRGTWKTVFVNSGYLALRNAYSYDSGNEIGQLYTGDTVLVDGECSGSYIYVYSPKYGTSGWVNAGFLG